jgi:hypothetical protein
MSLQSSPGLPLSAWLWALHQASLGTLCLTPFVPFTPSAVVPQGLLSVLWQIHGSTHLTTN